MKRFILLLVCDLACAVAIPARASAQELDACALLASDEIKGVQGESVTAAKGSHQPNRQFTMAHCFYTLGSSSKGVSLSIAVSSPERPDAPREFWRDRFQRERERASRARAGRGREPADDAEPVPGVGDEAFWVGDARIGSLYVLAGRRFFRLSVGGVTDPQQRRERSLVLARAVLKRLASNEQPPGVQWPTSIFTSELHARGVRTMT